jgi:hypothetical protein
MNKINLTKMIFDYWKNHIECPVETIKWGLECDPEGLVYYDGYNATFWYILNLGWYKMNNKLYASAKCKEPFDDYLNDLEKDYLKENGYV